MACVYILLSNLTGKFYTGSSRKETAQIRLMAHNNGKSRSTKSGRPWVLIHQEIYATYTDARKREIFLKTGVGRQWVNEKFNRTRRDG